MVTIIGYCERVRCKLWILPAFRAVPDVECIVYIPLVNMRDKLVNMSVFEYSERMARNEKTAESQRFGISEMRLNKAI